MSKGRYGIHGGQYIPETLMHEIENLEKAYEHYKKIGRASCRERVSSPV